MQYKHVQLYLAFIYPMLIQFSVESNATSR